MTDPAAGTLEPSWQRELAPALAAPTMRNLRALLRAERAAGHHVYPPRAQIFNAFTRSPFDATRVVIVGQDPYHGPGQAMGLSFSVPPVAPIPPSLRNIFTELESDLGIARPSHGDLSSWADQGVLLLNTSLTVRAGEAGSHSGRGWEQLTDAAISALAERRSGIVFLLWGRHAHAKQSLIDPARHLILTAPHPSPLAAHRGFFGCRHFSRANAYLCEQGVPPIDWQLPAHTESSSSVSPHQVG